MAAFTAADIQAATGARLRQQTAEFFSGVVTDTRKIVPGVLFLALRKLKPFNLKRKLNKLQLKLKRVLHQSKLFVLQLQLHHQHQLSGLRHQ